MKPAPDFSSQLEFASHPGNLCLMREFVRRFLAPLQFSDSDKDLLILGLDEACTNVIRYAYEHQCNQLMCLSCELCPEGVTFRLRDYGRQCDPAKFNGRPLEQVQPGGLGIHLIRK